MDYPNRFDTPAFPAGKSIALSRVIAIQILIVFFLIICACGVLIFFIKSEKNYPFLISVDPLTDEWNVVAAPYKNRENVIEQYQLIQEKLVNDFTDNWFSISSKQSVNNARWAECSVDECSFADQYNPKNQECALFCMSGTDLFTQFSTKVLPEYTARINQASETWVVEKKDIMPYYVTEDSSKWQVYAQIKSNINGVFNVLAFVDIRRTDDLHPVTMGYYVDDFNAYRVNQ